MLAPNVIRKLERFLFKYLEKAYKRTAYVKWKKLSIGCIMLLFLLFSLGQ